MQNQALPSKTRNNNKPHRSGKNIVAVIIVGLCASSIIGLYLMEMVPHYIVLSIAPPKDSYDSVDWRSTTKSVLTESMSSGLPASRDFIWRRDTILAYEEYDDIPSWDMLAGYFDKQFSQLGWKQNDAAPPCNIYLPEAAFLKYGKNGYLSYRRISDTDEIPMGDTICLAIWNDAGYPNVFRVVLLSVRRSVVTNFYGIFDQ